MLSGTINHATVRIFPILQVDVTLPEAAGLHLYDFMHYTAAT